MGKDGPVTAQFIPTCCVHCVSQAPAYYTSELNATRMFGAGLDTPMSDIVKPPVVDTANGYYGYYEGDVWIWVLPPGPGMGVDGDP